MITSLPVRVSSGFLNLIRRDKDLKGFLNLIRSDGRKPEGLLSPEEIETDVDCASVFDSVPSLDDSVELTVLTASMEDSVVSRMLMGIEEVLLYCTGRLTLHRAFRRRCSILGGSSNIFSFF